MVMEGIYNLTEQEYFLLTDEEKEELAKRVLSIIKNDRRLFLPELFDVVFLPVLNNELIKAEKKEDYMLCDAIKYIIKIHKDEKGM